MKRLASRRERAQVLPLTAVIIVALLGVLALVVDVGMLWMTQRELQKTADAAAQGGVILLPDVSRATAEATCYATPSTPKMCNAKWYVQENLGLLNALVPSHLLCTEEPTSVITAGERAVGSGTFYTLTATVQCSAGFTFGLFASIQPNDMDTVHNECNCVRASATSVIGSNKSPDCPAPFAVSDVNEGVDRNGGLVFAGDPGVTWEDTARNGSGYLFGQLTELHVDSAGATNGNFHSIQFGTDSGAGPYKNQLANNCTSTPNIQPGEFVTTQPGDMTGPTAQGLQARGLVSCTGPGQPALCTNNNYPAPHPDFELACPDNPLDLSPADSSGVLGPGGALKRTSLCLTQVVVVVPLAFPLSGGRSQIQVEGFAEFFIAGWDRHEKSVWGMFVKGAPTLGELGAYDLFGTIVTRLIR
jgi:hypothetical protein